MVGFEPRLTEARRAGLLAAVAVYPLSRLAGTVPRPALDRALVSGTSMAVAFQLARVTTAALRTTQGFGGPSPLRQSMRTAAVTVAVTVGVGAVAGEPLRARSRALAARGRRSPLRESTLSATAEILTLSAGAGALVAVGDALLLALPGRLREIPPAVRGVGVVVTGAALGLLAVDPRVLAHFGLPAPEGAVDGSPTFQFGARVPVAVARSGGVALAAIAGLAGERAAAHGIARVLTRRAHPGRAAVVGGHLALAGCAAAAGAVGFATYSSRVAVHEKLLEAAYAAVPSRPGVTGGTDSAYAFGSLGREGRRFVSQAYTATELSDVLGEPCVDPVRAWLPLDHLTGVPATDAQALVDEVERLGGFARGTLVLAAPTGDGYVSYVQTESVELLTRGDCATVVVPYDDVPSALAMPRRKRAATAFAAYARALAARARTVNPQARLFVFGESLGSIVALDAFGPDVVDELRVHGFAGGLYCGVPVFSRTDRALRPRHPATREANGLQYATGRDQALGAGAGHLNLTHPTDPVAVADPTVVVRHGIDYWGRPHGVHVPVVSFLIHLFDVKNAMSLRPGEFTPSPGHDYRFDTAAGVAQAYGLPFDNEAVVEAALRERELAWSVRRLLGRRLGEAADATRAKLTSWGVDPASVSTRFHLDPDSLPGWLTTPMSADADSGPEALRRS